MSPPHTPFWLHGSNGREVHLNRISPVARPRGGKETVGNVMEKHRPVESRTDAPKITERPETDESRSDSDTREQSALVSRQEIADRLGADREQETRRRMWGRVLVVLGAVTILDSWSMFPIPLIGFPAIVVGVVVMMLGGTMLAGRRRLKDTNEALMIAMKYGNRLTVARLALELDISLNRAEKIVKKLVDKGIAEIDLDSLDPDEGIVYKIRGI